MKYTHDRIVRDSNVLGGKPCIRGTRITVQQLLEDFADGMAAADVLAAYQQLTEDDVRAALAYAAEYMDHEGLLPA